MIAVLKRELNSYFKGIIGYLFAAFLLVFAGIYTMAFNLSGQYAYFEYALDSISFIYLIGVPILTMRAVAEEKRQKTDQLLYSLPISVTSVVVGKYFAMLAVLLVPTLVMACYPLVLTLFGNPYLPTAYSSLFAFFMLGATLLSIGLFISSVTESQIASAVICLVTMLILYFMSDLAGFVSADATASLIALGILAVICAVIFYLFTKNWVVSFLIGGLGLGGLLVWFNVDAAAFSGLFPNVMKSLSAFDRFYGFINGVFDLTAIVYFLSVIAVFLFFSVQVLEKRRWSE
ncbi:MAG: ABC transporter [Clostridiales bacterium]|nr:ABC transporter [Clostridiales bacterium]